MRLDRIRLVELAAGLGLAAQDLKLVDRRADEDFLVATEAIAGALVANVDLAEDLLAALDDHTRGDVTLNHCVVKSGRRNEALA